MTPSQQRRLAHTASRDVPWTLFFALLTSPFGGYLYLGRLGRAGVFFLVFAIAMALVGYAIDTYALPIWLADLTVAVGFLGSLADLVWLIVSARKALRAQGLPVKRSIS